MECWRVEHWVRRPPQMLHYSTLRHSIIVLFGGRNIKLNSAEVASAPPKIANESP